MDYNSYNLKDKLGLSNAGSLKLLRGLSGKKLIIGRKMGNAIFYKPNLANEYLIKLLELIFMELHALSDYAKGWLEDLKVFIPFTEAIILFGSVLKKGKEVRDIDVCFVLKDAESYDEVNLLVKEINKKNRLKIHPLYMTEREFEKKLKEKDMPLISMVKSCVVVYGQDVFVRILKHVQN